MLEWSFSKPDANHCVPLHKIFYTLPVNSRSYSHFLYPSTHFSTFWSLIWPLRSPSCFFSMNMPENPCFWDLCTYCGLCLEFSSSRYFHGSLPLPSLGSNIILRGSLSWPSHKLGPPSTLYALYPNLLVFIALGITWQLLTIPYGIFLCLFHKIDNLKDFRTGPGIQ